MRGHHQGSVYQRKDGKWYAAVSLPNGRRRTVTAATEEEAHQRLAVLRKDSPRHNLYIKTSRASFADLIERHLAWAAAEGWGVRRTAMVMAVSLSNARIKYGICGPCVYCGTALAGSGSISTAHAFYKNAGGVR